ncbi:MAG: hypothetical protein FWE69_08350 [Clostridiales bacterium]|nr:hypothetical protein [Clostridiales bacterium]
MKLYSIILIFLSTVLVIGFIARCRSALDRKNIPRSRKAVQQQFVWTLLGGGLMLCMILSCFAAIFIPEQAPLNDWGAAILLVLHLFGCALLIRGMVRAVWVHPDKIVIEDAFGRVFVYACAELSCYPRRTAQIYWLKTPRTRYLISQKSPGADYLARMVLKAGKQADLQGRARVD